MAKQPESCVSCGEDTAAGTTSYSDRQVLDRDGPAPRYLCAECAQAVAHGRRDVPMNEKDRQALEESASAFGAHFLVSH